MSIATLWDVCVKRDSRIVSKILVSVGKELESQESVVMGL
jgi:hypothetical protein